MCVSSARAELIYFLAEALDRSPSVFRRVPNPKPLSRNGEQESGAGGVRLRPGGGAEYGKGETLIAFTARSPHKGPLNLNQKSILEFFVRATATRGGR